MARVVTGLVILLAVSSRVFAEHRVALLIGITEYQDSSLSVDSEDLAVVAKGLEKYGFACQLARNLDEKGLKAKIENFASRTPTRSTALVYFNGQARSFEGDGKRDVALLGTRSRPGRGYSLSEAARQLSTRGGSNRNLIVINCPNPPSTALELPEKTLLAVRKDSVVESLNNGGDLIRLVSFSSNRTQATLENGDTLTGEGSDVVAASETFTHGSKAGDEWVNSMGLVFCWCPPGKYIAGSPKNERGRYPDEEQREVTIKHGFWLSKYELARSQEVAKRRPGNGTIARHKLHPMTLINHDDATAMTRNFTDSERKAGRLPSDWQYSLPTEEQWEYAARAGTTTRFYFGENLNQLARHANFGDRSYYDSGDIFSNSAHRTLNDGAVRVSLVGSYEPNPWGLHDMYGNVAEWCINRGIRGGSWVSVPENCRSAYRDSFSSRNEQNFIGYRLVIQKNPPTTK